MYTICHFIYILNFSFSYTNLSFFISLTSITSNKIQSVSGPVSTRDNRVFNGPLGRSLRSFARTALSLRSASLALFTGARSIHGLARSLRSLPRGTVEIHEYVFKLKSRFTGTIEVFVVSRDTPSLR